MITLILSKKNENEDPVIINFTEEDWEFSIRFGSTLSDNDNFLTISNPNKRFSNSENIISFYNNLKEIPKNDIGYVQLYVDNIKVFDSRDFNFYFNGLFLQYQYVNVQSNVNRGPRGNSGLNVFINFSNYNQEDEGEDINGSNLG